MSDLIAAAWEAEELLLTPEARTDPTRLDALLAEDFHEIGRSGRRWNRAETVAALLLESDEPGPAPEPVLSERDARPIGSDTVLLTYRLDIDGRTSRRSSLWRREGGMVRCFFHQGTPPPA